MESPKQSPSLKFKIREKIQAGLFKVLAENKNEVKETTPKAVPLENPNSVMNRWKERSLIFHPRSRSRETMRPSSLPTKPRLNISFTDKLDKLSEKEEKKYDSFYKPSDIKPRHRKLLSLVNQFGKTKNKYKDEISLLTSPNCGLPEISDALNNFCHMAEIEMELPISTHTII